MAGGEGTRLRPLTSNQPKPMVPIVGKPCMEHILELLKEHGFEDVVIAGGAEMMSSYAANASGHRTPFMDNGNTRLRERHPQTNQGVAADAIATIEGVVPAGGNAKSRLASPRVICK